MNIKSVLKKEGITNIRPLDILTINKISKNISHKLYETFNEHNINESDLFISISRLQMYFAQMPEDASAAKYFYKNQSIYFNDKFSIDEIEEFAIHECIHYLQEIKDEKGNLLRLGLYDISEGSNKGMGLNEAAVQLMAATASGAPIDKVKYYDLFLVTESPEYYPLQCVILKEMMYFTGNYPLYHSTLYSDDVFKNTFSSKFGKRAYYKIEKNVDELLTLEALLNTLTTEVKYTNRQRKIKQTNQLIDQCKDKIANLFIETQDFIIELCFETEFNEIHLAQYLRESLGGDIAMLDPGVDLSDDEAFLFATFAYFVSEIFVVLKTSEVARDGIENNPQIEAFIDLWTLRLTGAPTAGDFKTKE